MTNPVTRIGGRSGDKPWWDANPGEEAIYEISLAQIYALLKKPQLDKATRVRLLLAVLRWQGKFEGSEERQKAFGELIKLSNPEGSDGSPTRALPADTQDPHEEPRRDSPPAQLGAKGDHPRGGEG